MLLAHFQARHIPACKACFAAFNLIHTCECVQHTQSYRNVLKRLLCWCYRLMVTCNANLCASAASSSASCAVWTRTPHALVKCKLVACYCQPYHSPHSLLVPWEIPMFVLVIIRRCQLATWLLITILTAFALGYVTCSCKSVASQLMLADI